MPIVKCELCGKMAFEVISLKEIRGGSDINDWLRQRVCQHCGKRRLVKAVWGKDYGFGERSTAETRRAQR